MNIKELRKKHHRFIYERFAYMLTESGLEIRFFFLLKPDIRFEPRIVIEGVTQHDLSRISIEALDNLIFHLGLAEIPSYWKCAVSPMIDIRSGKLAPAQIRFWKKLLAKGLAEFFYANRIKPGKHFVRILSNGPAYSLPIRAGTEKERALALVGGGKDSLVALQIFKKAHNDFRPMILGRVPAAYRLLKSLETKKPIVILREIDPTLIALNKIGYLNGHTPFSAYLAFLGTLTAEIFGYTTVAVANERSANEPTLRVHGKEINHQYSKSYEFEHDFRAYADTYLTKRSHYASMLRPLYEIQIARLASTWPRALACAVSCNAGQKKAEWCGRCAKCLAVFILLFPFMKTGILTKIFKKNLLDDASLWHFIPALLGEKGDKPFDCVGTKNEMRAALILSLRKAKEEERVPKLLARFEREFLPQSRMSEAAIRKILAGWDDRNFLSKDLVKALQSMMEA